MLEQVVINSAEFARNHETLRASVAIEKLGRLHDLLHSGEGELEYALTGRRDKEGKLFLTCSVNGVLQLRCQRCLEAMPYQLSLESELELAEEEPDWAVMPEEDESADLIKADPKLDVPALIEDEILLALPMAPMHEAADCKSGADVKAASTKKNPFSVLESLKTRN